MTPAALLCTLLKGEPDLEVREWTELLTIARAESLLATLGHRLEHASVPPRVTANLAVARADAERAQVRALWEAEMARRALSDIPFVLLKGTAYAAAGLDAAHGRTIGDLDILVPRDRLGEAEVALAQAGWEWVKPDPYDDLYYRRWMHELPPLIHRERDRMIDVHHTILPLTARPTPDAEALLADAVTLQNGFRILCPADMLIHCAAHLIADGDLAGGLRNLWDFDRLARQSVKGEGQDRLTWSALLARAERHQLASALTRAAHLAHSLYATPIPASWRTTDSLDPLFRHRLLARDGWGRATRPAIRLAFYARSHWLRMPPLMLARHLWAKANRS